MGGRRQACMAALVLAGCGRIGFAPGSEATDADSVPADSATIDAAPLGPFGPATRLTEIDTGMVEDDFSLSRDMLEIIFTRAPGTISPGDLYRATRATTLAPFDPPTAVTELNTAGHDGAPHLSVDGLTLWFTREQGVGTNNYDLWQATRPTRGAAWTNAMVIAALSSALADQQPKLDETETRIVFATSNVNVALASGELWEATRTTPTGAWNPPSKIASLNTTGGELGPCYADNGLTLYFYSDRLAANVDIYRASRTTLDQPFGPAEHVDELATTGRDEDPWLSPDARTIFFTRSDAIWQASR